MIFALCTGAAAQSDLVPDSVLEGAGSRTPEGRRAVQSFLVGDGPAPKVIAARAAVAIRDLAASGLYAASDDLLAAAGNIAAVAQPALCAAKVMHAFVPDNFQLPAGAVGYDFGPPDGTTMPSFEAVGPGDKRIAGSGPRGLHRSGTNNLLSDGIVGMRRFVTPIVNGTHRILLMTDDIGDEPTALSPLGNRIIVNGKTIDLGDHPSTDWLREAVLQNPEAPPTVTDTNVDGVPIDSQRGGVLMVEVEVRNGQLEIEMQQPGGSGRSSYLVGLVAAPIARGDVLGRYFDASEAVLDTDECLALEEEINEAIVELIEEIAPAAGPQEVQDLPDAVFEDGEAASPA